MKFVKKALEPFLWMLAVCLAVTWALLPNSSLEPYVVLATLAASTFPIYSYRLKPIWDELWISKHRFQYLILPHKVNAKEIGSEVFDGFQLKLLNQKTPYYPTKIETFFSQTSFIANVYFDEVKRTRLSLDFSVGNHRDEYKLPKESNHYFIAQFDIDSDGTDELLIGVIDEGEINSSCEVWVLKYHSPQNEMDVGRVENWKIDKCLSTHLIGQPNVHIKKHILKIPRNHRDMYYKWIFIDGEMIDRSTS